MAHYTSYWQSVWGRFKKHPVGLLALIFISFIFLVGLYAPFLASSKPLLVVWHDTYYFPLFRYLFYTGYFSKPIDLFYNLLMFTLPAGVAIALLFKGTLKKNLLLGLMLLHFLLFGWIIWGPAFKDPASDPALQQKRRDFLQKNTVFRDDPLLAPFPFQPTWDFELNHMSPYAQLNSVLKYQQRQDQEKRLAPASRLYLKKYGTPLPSLAYIEKKREGEIEKNLQKTLQSLHDEHERARETLPALTADYLPFSHAFAMAKFEVDQKPYSAEAAALYEQILQAAAPYRQALVHARQVRQKYLEAETRLRFIQDRNQWLEKQNLTILIPPLLRPFHWEEDAGGSQLTNKVVPFLELTRINRKDLVASLLFGIRVSLMVGISAILIALSIGIPTGLLAGYFSGKLDMVICRILEVWEAMPIFFMLLLLVAITQTKSVFLVIAVLGIFGWTGFSRFMRGEVLKQRGLSYVLACQSLGYGHSHIMFSHILPNAIPPILTLIPFSLMAAITSEAGLSFLGLGEEGSSSWGVLMDEGRSVFPGESYLIWPPAILLTLLLIAIALVGDAFRDALDPKTV